MSAQIVDPAGTIRSATPEDAPALSRLLACVGRDALPVTAGDVAVLLSRGHLLVLDLGAGPLGAGTLGAAAHAVLDRTGGERHAVVRYLAVHPELEARQIEPRMTAAMLERCSGARSLPAVLATPAQIHALRDHIARRMVHMMMFLLALPRVIASAGHHGPAVFVLVWSALALISARRTPLLPPRAIVRRPRAARLRAWGDAVLVRLGELPVALPGRHAVATPWQLVAETPPAPPA